MLEFHERTTLRGQFSATLISDDLTATGSTCVIVELHGSRYSDGRSRFQRKTCNGSAGSTRYAVFNTLDEAYATARAWAKRKIAAHQKDRGLAAAMVFARFARALGNPQADSRGYVR